MNFLFSDFLTRFRFSIPVRNGEKHSRYNFTSTEFVDMRKGNKKLNLANSLNYRHFTMGILQNLEPIRYHSG